MLTHDGPHPRHIVIHPILGGSFETNYPFARLPLGWPSFPQIKNPPIASPNNESYTFKKLARSGLPKDIIHITRPSITFIKMACLFISPAIIANPNSSPAVRILFARTLHSDDPVSSPSTIPTFPHWAHSGNVFLSGRPPSPSAIGNSTYFGFYVSISTYVYSANSTNPNFRVSPRMTAPSSGVGFPAPHHLPSLYPPFIRSAPLIVCILISAHRWSPVLRSCRLRRINTPRGSYTFSNLR